MQDFDACRQPGKVLCFRGRFDQHRLCLKVPVLLDHHQQRLIDQAVAEIQGGQRLELLPDVWTCADEKIWTFQPEL